MGTAIALALLVQLPPLPTFGSATVPLATKQQGLCAADFTGDGRPDLAWVYRTSASVELAAGTAGGFAALISIASMTAPNSVSAADLNGDGRLDPIVRTFDDSGTVYRIAVSLSNASGGWNGPTYASLPSTSGIIGEVRAGDVDGNGLPDLVATDWWGSLETFYNAGGGLFGAPVTTFIPTTLKVTTLDLGDTDLDGFLDAYAGGAGASAPPGTMWELRGNGVGFGAPSPIVLPTSPAALRIGDVSGDGVPDLVVGRTWAGGPVLTPGGLTIRRGTPGGALGAPQDIAFSPAAFPVFRALHLVDVNSDGSVDIAYMPVPNKIGAYLSLLPAGIQGFLGWETTTTGTGLEVLDVDANGAVDFIAPNDDAATAVLLTNAAALPAGLTPFGTGTPGCAGTLGLSANGAPQVGNSKFRFVASGAPPSRLGLLIVGDVAQPVGADLLGLGFLLHVNPLASAFLLGFNAIADDSGFAAAPAPIANNPVLAGGNYTAQFIGLEDSANGTKCGPSPYALVSSRGLSITIQP